jgi:hypothetical protein
MTSLLPTRAVATLAGFALCLLVAISAPEQQATAAAPLQNNAAAPHPGSTPVGHRTNTIPTSNTIAAKNEHLLQWIDRHSNLTPEQQLQAFGQEHPGFRSLPPEKQQQLRARLAELNAMPPAKRKHLLEWNETMARLNPAQRSQVNNAMKQLAALPQDQHLYVARTFRGLRELPPEQRKAVLSSDRFDHLNNAERATLNSLMAVESLLPPPYDPDQPGH